MRRADLLLLSDEDLIGAASKLTLRRAQRDLDSGALEVELREEEDRLVAVWSDGVRCELPAEGGLAASRCTCPARRLCVHRVRTILALRGRADDMEAEESPAAEEPADGWTPACFPDEALRRAPGYEQALRMLHEGLEVVRESATSVTLPELGVRVRYVPNRGLEEALCSCGAPSHCLHRLLGALGSRDELPPLEDAPVTEAGLARLWSVASMLAGAGLDGLPAEAVELLETTRLWARGEGLHGAAKDLATLAGLLERYHRRDARFDGRRWLWTICRLALRSELLPGSRGAARRLLLGRGRTGRAPGKQLSLVALGAEPFVGREGVVLRVYLARRDDERVSVTTLGRGGSADPARLYRATPLFGRYPARELMGRAFVLHRPRLGPDGTLSAGGDARVGLVEEGTAFEEVLPRLVARSLGALVERWRELPPPLLREEGEHLLALLALDTAHLPEPRFDEIAQRLELTLRLHDGGRLPLVVTHREDRAAAIEALEGWPHWDARPSHLLARLTLARRGLVAHPVTLYAGARAYQLTLGEAPPLGLGVEPSRPDGPTLEATPDASLHPAEDAVEAALDTVEGAVASGLDGCAAWRLERLREHVRELSRAHIDGGAARLRALIDASSPDDRLRAAAGLVLFATTLAEWLRVERLS